MSAGIHRNHHTKLGRSGSLQPFGGRRRSVARRRSRQDGRLRGLVSALVGK
jgi:hypothetical protein